MSVTQGSYNSTMRPGFAVSLELIKPITWFPPMWAYFCGVVSSGVDMLANWPILLLGIVLAGPVVCGMSQAANDWCDRHVDAINEPHRPIPSGRMPGRWGLWIALGMSFCALALGLFLGIWGAVATALAVGAAWAYSAEPLRFKRSWLWGPGLVGLCYEGLPWFTGAAVALSGLPSLNIISVAALYAIGAHGIMTLNDFKAVEGDLKTGVRSLPAVYGIHRAAQVACATMAGAQLVVIAMLALLGQHTHALIIAALLGLQAAAMRKMLLDPAGKAPWYNGTGVLLYIIGMMVAALALRHLGGAV